MKGTFCVLIILLNTVLVSGQINYQYNGIHCGDELIKQQVNFKDPGKAGENVIWDFGKLKSVNDEYTLVYSSPTLIGDSIFIMGGDTIAANSAKENELVIGTEHYTMYYYHQKENLVEVLGHENPTTFLRYLSPLIVSPLPMNYKDTHQSSYQSKGIYSAKIPFTTTGTVQVKADAYGIIVLPSGDTLNHVLRVKTIQTMEETIPNTNNQENVHFSTTVERYKWYSKGYRYPVFETVRAFNNQDTLKQTEFQTAFFFPPQNHLYLEDDKENLAVLDSLWNLEQPKDINNPTINPETNTKLFYNLYPNPVVTELTIEYYLESATTVAISLYSMDGKLMKYQPIGNQSRGLHTQYLDCSTLSQGTYILRIEANNKITSDKIKK